MSFMMKKKRFKFAVNFEVEELASVPSINMVLFAKIRLLDGGNFTEQSPRVAVADHSVQWHAKFKFPCKVTASANTGILEPCVCRVSVRKELKGGKSFQKLGFADINLSEFAGGGRTTRRYLLEGYDSKRRQDNSTLKVNIDMTIMSADPCFKVPRPQKLTLPGAEGDADLQPENKGADEFSEDSVASSSSGFGSLPRGKPCTSLLQDLGGSDPNMKTLEADRDKPRESTAGELGHCRNPSFGSQLSKASGYSSSHTGTHSRQSSYGSGTGHTRKSLTNASPERKQQTMSESPSTGSCMSDKFGSLRTKKKEGGALHERRVDITRVDNEELVEELIQNTDFHIDESAETSGLQLFVARDGTTALGSQQTRNQPQRGKFEQVIFDQS